MPSPPTVAVDLRALVPAATGIGVYTRSLLGALAHSEALNYLGVSHQPIRSPEALRDLGVSLESHPAPLGVLWQQLKLPKRLEHSAAELFWSPLGTLPWRLPVPSVVTVHDLTVLTHPETHSLKVRLSMRPFLGRSLAQSSAIVAISQATASDLRRIYPRCADRLHVVYNGVDPTFQPADDQEIEAFRKRLGCPQGYILYVGTLEPRKNVGTLLEAWAGLKQDHPETPPLVIAGAAGWRNKALLQRIRELEGLGLRHLGHLPREDLIRLYQSAAVFAYPSLYEGFGLPPLEAMACGVPTVVSNVSSLPEVVGDAGLQVAPRDTQALGRSLRDVLSQPDLSVRLSRSGPSRARRFSWERSAREMERIFLEVLGTP
ncbi:MAG: glycosyltransferase family 4 protein [Deltaproteobacteria bacterium]|nr:glycosyltransferase family 4 protein [Deltaproteobacteria bacterium]